LKSLQEKARDIRLVHAELDIIRGEKLQADKHAALLNDELQKQQITLRQKEEESSRCQELVRFMINLWYLLVVISLFNLRVDYKKYIQTC